MKIVKVETHAVGAAWKNWLFVKVITDDGMYGISEATINGFIRTTEAAVHELEHLVVGRDPRQVNAIARGVIKTIQDAGHIHRLVMAAIEVACWDILGKSLGVPIHQLLGGRHRDSILAYANGWYRAERTPGEFVKAAEAVVGMGFRALKLDPFGLAQGFIGEKDLQVAYDIIGALRERFGRDLMIMIDVHTRFAPCEALRAAQRMAPLGITWWEEPTTGEREQPTNELAGQCPISVATGEQFDKVGRFVTLAQGGGVSIFQPEPMSLGGITNTIAVAALAEANGGWVAPHQSGGPVATAVCLQLAACIPNYMIQEHFDPFNEAWTKDLVVGAARLDPQTGHLPIPTGPGLGVDLDMDVVRKHGYDPNAYFDIHQEGWEKRIGTCQQ
jgi:galactonate dehydratase